MGISSISRMCQGLSIWGGSRTQLLMTWSQHGGPSSGGNFLKNQQNQPTNEKVGTVGCRCRMFLLPLLWIVPHLGPCCPHLAIFNLSVLIWLRPPNVFSSSRLCLHWAVREWSVSCPFPRSATILWPRCSIIHLPDLPLRLMQKRCLASNRCVSCTVQKSQDSQLLASFLG